MGQNPDSLQEANLFRDGPEVAEVTKSLSRKLGFTIDLNYGTYMLFVSEVKIPGERLQGLHV